MTESKFNIELINKLYDVSWQLMDYLRDKRHSVQRTGSIRPKKHAPQEVLQAVVDLNILTSQILSIYNRPSGTGYDTLPTEVVEVTRETISHREQQPPIQ